MNILYYDKNSCNPEELQMIYEHIEALHKSGKIEETIILPKYCDFDEDISFKAFEKIYETIYDKYLKMKAGYDLEHPEPSILDKVTAEISPALEDRDNCPNCGCNRYEEADMVNPDPFRNSVARRCKNCGFIYRKVL